MKIKTNNWVLTQEAFDRLKKTRGIIDISGRETTTEKENYEKQIQIKRRNRKFKRLLRNKQTIMIIVFILGVFSYFSLPVEADEIKKNSDPMWEYWYLLWHFPTVKTVIWCYNDISKTTRESMRCTKKGDHNITLPTREHIKIWLKYYNDYEILNRLALVNFESNFDENAENHMARGYVQTLKSYNIPIDIDSQLNWLKNRNKTYKKVYYGGKYWRARGCGYYWNNNNPVDWYPKWEYWVLACLYRFHYNANTGMWYAKRGMLVTKFYKKYMFGIID